MEKHLMDKLKNEVASFKRMQGEDIYRQLKDLLPCHDEEEDLVKVVSILRLYVHLRTETQFIGLGKDATLNLVAMLFKA